ncbi:hypothetical protein KUF57_21315 [Mycolicibacterium sp. PAM1]|uniref:hypothetical protein n=1 Tax=Mycolicibacterium sp. PAM1 TaxID=2853535 RepID=UPI001300D833|nr:hypothetical protein [Mycolicibacterium sp. PAM1]MBV5246084.1 hypothetical protein [Mycolicibacterium sp. PAM1]
MALSTWMNDKEVEWRERLRAVKLVVETNFSAHEVRETQKRYGAAARGLLHRDWTHEQFIKRFPALTTTFFFSSVRAAISRSGLTLFESDSLGLRPRKKAILSALHHWDVAGRLAHDSGREPFEQPRIRRRH